MNDRKVLNPAKSSCKCCSRYMLSLKGQRHFTNCMFIFCNLFYFPVDYLSEEVPVKIHLEAFNPCIPLDSMNSGIPVIIFNFTVTNPLSAAVKVSLHQCNFAVDGWGSTSATFVFCRFRSLDLC